MERDIFLCKLEGLRNEGLVNFKPYFERDFLGSAWPFINTSSESIYRELNGMLDAPRELETEVI